jgi:hypothetical protein
MRATSSDPSARKLQGRFSGVEFDQRACAHHFIAQAGRIPACEPSHQWFFVGFSELRDLRHPSLEFLMANVSRTSEAAGYELLWPLVSLPLFYAKLILVADQAFYVIDRRCV